MNQLTENYRKLLMNTRRIEGELATVNEGIDDNRIDTKQKKNLLKNATDANASVVSRTINNNFEDDNSFIDQHIKDQNTRTNRLKAIQERRRATGRQDSSRIADEIRKSEEIIRQGSNDRERFALLNKLRQEQLDNDHAEKLSRIATDIPHEKRIRSKSLLLDELQDKIIKLDELNYSITNNRIYGLSDNELKALMSSRDRLKKDIAFDRKALSSLNKKITMKEFKMKYVPKVLTKKWYKEKRKNIGKFTKDVTTNGSVINMALRSLSKKEGLLGDVSRVARSKFGWDTGDDLSETEFSDDRQYDAYSRLVRSGNSGRRSSKSSTSPGGKSNNPSNNARSGSTANARPTYGNAPKPNVDVEIIKEELTNNRFVGVDLSIDKVRLELLAKLNDIERLLDGATFNGTTEAPEEQGFLGKIMGWALPFIGTLLGGGLATKLAMKLLPKSMKEALPKVIAKIPKPLQRFLPKGIKDAAKVAEKTGAKAAEKVVVKVGEKSALKGATKAGEKAVIKVAGKEVTKSTLKTSEKIVGKITNKKLMLILEKIGAKMATKTATKGGATFVEAVTVVGLLITAADIIGTGKLIIESTRIYDNIKGMAAGEWKKMVKKNLTKEMIEDNGWEDDDIEVLMDMVNVLRTTNKLLAIPLIMEYSYPSSIVSWIVDIRALDFTTDNNFDRLSSPWMMTSEVSLKSQMEVGSDKRSFWQKAISEVKKIAGMASVMPSVDQTYLEQAEIRNDNMNKYLAAVKGGYGSDYASKMYLDKGAETISKPELLKRSQSSMDYLMSKYGLTQEQAAGIIGNLMQENRLRTGMSPILAVDASRGVTQSGGIAQWNNERLDSLMAFAKSKGTKWDDLNTQLDFIMHEMGTTHKDAGNALRSSDNVVDATTSFMDEFEKPNPSYAHTENRVSYAQQILDNYNKSKGKTVNHQENVDNARSYSKVRVSEAYSTVNSNPTNVKMIPLANATTKKGKKLESKDLDNKLDAIKKDMANKKNNVMVSNTVVNNNPPKPNRAPRNSRTQSR